MNPLNPSLVIAFFQLFIVMFGPNCPSVAGAAIAYTFLFGSNNALITLTIYVFEPIAPNGQLWIHLPHLIHFSSSITEIPYSLYVIALTGQENLHGLFKCAIALYGHACAHLPHSLHFCGSICERWRPASIAPNLHALMQAFPIQF